MALTDQLKGAPGIEFITKNLSAYDSSDDNTFKIGLVGWTTKGPANQVVSINNVNDLYSTFGKPGKNPKYNQMLYAARILLDTGAIVKLVREVEVTEQLNATAIMFDSSNSSILNYDTIMSGDYSGTYSGADSYYGVYTGYTAVSNSISDVVDNKLDNLEIDALTTSTSPFTIAFRYPGFDDYYITVQTYSYFNSTTENANIGKARDKFIDTLTSKSITQDVEFTSYVTAQGIYDVLQDRFFPAETYTLTLDNDTELTVTGIFKRYSSTTGLWTINEDLTEFVHVFGMIRVYSSSTSSTPVATIPFTRINYVTVGDVQLKLDDTTKSTTIVKGVINDKFTGTWLGRTPYIITKSTGSSYETVDNKVELKPMSTNPTAPNEAPDYTYGWGLFKNIEAVKVNLLASAGTTVYGFGSKLEAAESLNIDTLTSMLEVCTVRKDCTAIFDLPKRKDYDELITLVETYIPGVGKESEGSNATFESYWGAMYDGRQIMYDKFNKKDVEVAMTSFVAQNIYNVCTNSYPWYVAAGTSRGTISYPSNGNLLVRYYPDEIGAMYLERINSVRNLDGQVIWGEATLQRKDTALNRAHATRLLAWLYGKLRTKLTSYVFELNTTTLRKTVTEEITEILEYAKNHNGLYNYYVICNDTNNTSDVIDNNQLMINIGLEITKSVETISVYTTLYRTNGIIELGLA